MKKLNGLCLLFMITHCSAQYYYKDLVSASDVTRLMKTYMDNNIKMVKASGITPEGATTADFSETHDISSNGKLLRITTRISQTTSALVCRFDDSGNLLSVKDSSAGLVSTSSYTYNNSGKIALISNIISDPDTSGNFSQNEIHQYIYLNGNLEKMWRIINQKDSLEVRFKNDENGNVIEERNFKRNIGTDPIYYYYDDKNRLTDIVRYNYKAQRLLPDFLFEYDNNNRVIQKITTTSNQNMGYLTWRYLYNEKGLKTKEALFNKEKVMQGRIDYTYQ